MIGSTWGTLLGRWFPVPTPIGFGNRYPTPPNRNGWEPLRELGGTAGNRRGNRLPEKGGNRCGNRGTSVPVMHGVGANKKGMDRVKQ